MGYPLNSWSFQRLSWSQKQSNWVNGEPSIKPVAQCQRNDPTSLFNSTNIYDRKDLTLRLSERTVHRVPTGLTHRDTFVSEIVFHPVFHCYLKTWQLKFCNTKFDNICLIWRKSHYLDKKDSLCICCRKQNYIWARWNVQWISVLFVIISIYLVIDRVKWIG